MDFFEILKAILFGIVEGITEWLPISSTGHMILLDELVKLNADIVIEIIGTWIWVKGNTYPVKSQLKALHFKWSSQKHMWYWGTLTHRVHNTMPMEYIRMKYGSNIYQYSKEERETIDAYN